jgi:predicted metal-dependent peptidase
MQFSKTIGKVEEADLIKCEKKLHSVFMSLASNYTNIMVGDRLGGDPLIYTLIAPVEHVLTWGIPTAATDGKRYYWNPNFILKHSEIGLRLVAAHEAWHAIYMHPLRRGSRHRKLWNWAVDYIVNYNVMMDLKNRNKNPTEMFNQHLGKFITLDQLSTLIKDPWTPVPGLEDFQHYILEEDPLEKLFLDGQGRIKENLTEEELKQINEMRDRRKFFFADPALSNDLLSPEKIYELLIKLLPKCDECGALGQYKIPENLKKKKQEKQKQKQEQQKKQAQQAQQNQQKQKSSQSQQNQQGQESQEDGNQSGNQPGAQPSNQPGQSCSSNQKGCSTCGHGKSHDYNKQQGQGQGQGQGQPGESGQPQPGEGGDPSDDYVDLFGLMDTLDDHMDAEESQEKLAKKLADAAENARRQAGYLPAGIEDEIGALIEPKVTFKDAIKAQRNKSRQGNAKNDWTRFKSRPMFAGLIVPKRINYVCKFVCVLDTSGSMSKNDLTYGVSQLQMLDDKAEGVVVPVDAQVYWDNLTVLRKCNPEAISKINVVGRGGTILHEAINDYKKYVKDVDFMIVITDGGIGDTDIAEMKNPGIPVFWILTSKYSFKPPFGKVFDLRD